MGASRLIAKIIGIFGVLLYIGSLSAQETFSVERENNYIISLSAGIASPYKAISMWIGRENSAYPAAWEIQVKGLKRINEWGYGLLLSGYRYKDKYNIENLHGQNLHEDILLVYLAPQISYRQEETLFEGVGAYYEAGIGYTLYHNRSRHINEIEYANLSGAGGNITIGLDYYFTSQWGVGIEAGILGSILKNRNSKWMLQSKNNIKILQINAVIGLKCRF